MPPSPPLLTAITDLSAHQAGDDVALAFSIPTRTTTGNRLNESPSVEILRGTLKADGSPDTKTLRVVHVIPGALLKDYFSENRVHFLDRLRPDEIKSYPSASLFYTVRTRASLKRASENSNFSIMRIFPVPEPIASMEVRVTESSIELNWLPPTRTSSGQPLTALSGYHVYRGEVDPSSAITSDDLSRVKWKSPLALLGSSDASNYRDSNFEFGRPYVYVVRSVVTVDGESLESSDSAPAIVNPRDTFPPASPQGLLATLTTGEIATAVVVDLSWSINLENDLAGYRVYRGESQDTPGQLLNTELLPTPSVRDTSVQPSHRYWYRVTAVDRAGNESPPSDSLVVDVPQLSP